MPLPMAKSQDEQTDNLATPAFVESQMTKMIELVAKVRILSYFSKSCQLTRNQIEEKENRMSAVLDDIKILIAAFQEQVLNVMVIIDPLRTQELVERREALQMLSPNGSFPSEDTGRDPDGEDSVIREEEDIADR